MQSRTPRNTPADLPEIRFRPAALKARHDGWTAARQLHFISMLAATKSVTAACRAVGMSRESAYALRDRPEARGGFGFAFAWRKALEPDFVTQERRHSPRALARIRRLAEARARTRPKVDEMEEMNGAPV